VYINQLEDEVKMLSGQLIKAGEELSQIQKRQQGQSNLCHNLILENQNLKKINETLKAKTPKELLNKISAQQHRFNAENDVLRNAANKNAAMYKTRISCLEMIVANKEKTIEELKQNNTNPGQYAKIQRKLSNLRAENKRLMLSITVRNAKIKMLSEKLAARVFTKHRNVTNPRPAQ
jgi:uncharacterized coiled-coil protein SlyX